MRRVQGCILRLLIDPKTPDHLSGNLQSFDGEYRVRFRDEDDLVAGLKEILAASIEKMKEKPGHEHTNGG